MQKPQEVANLMEQTAQNVVFEVDRQGIPVVLNVLGYLDRWDDIRVRQGGSSDCMFREMGIVHDVDMVHQRLGLLLGSCALASLSSFTSSSAKSRSSQDLNALVTTSAVTRGCFDCKCTINFFFFSGGSTST